MSTRKPRESELDGDLVDPSFGANATPEPAPVGRPSQPNPQVLVGGGEREARAYVPPTALPSGVGPNPNEGGGKVAIASSVDPRRMPTVRLAPGRPRPPLAPGERPQPPEAPMQYVPGTSRPGPPAFVEAAPRSQPDPGGPRSMPASSQAEPSSTPAVVWILAVLLAALVGAGAALWIRRNMAVKPDPAAPAAAPNAPALTAPAAPVRPTAPAHT